MFTYIATNPKTVDLSCDFTASLFESQQIIRFGTKINFEFWAKYKSGNSNFV